MARRLNRLRRLVAVPLGGLVVAVVLGQGEAPTWEAVRSRPDPALRPPLDREPKLRRLPMRSWWQAAGGPHLSTVTVSGAARGPLVELNVELRYLLARPAMPPGIQPDLPDTLVEVLGVPYLQHSEVVYAGRGWARLESLRLGELRLVQTGPDPAGERRRVELRIRALAPRDEAGHRQVILGLGPLPIENLAATLEIAGGAEPAPAGPWRWHAKASESSTLLSVQARRVQGEAVLVAAWTDRLEGAPAGEGQGLLVEDLGPGAVRWLPPDQVRSEDRGVPVEAALMAPLVAAAEAPVEPPRPPLPDLASLPTTWFSGEGLAEQCRDRQARLAEAFASIRRPGGVPPHWPAGWEETVAPAEAVHGRGVTLRPRRARLALPRRSGEWFPVEPLLPWLAAEGVLDFHPSDPGNVRETLKHFLLLGDGRVACLIHGSHAAPQADRRGRKLSARDQLQHLGVTDPAILDAAYDRPLP